MHIFLTGATGLIGSAVLRGLVDAGHEVTALVRCDAAVERLRSATVHPVLGDMTDGALVTSLAAQADGVIHTAATGDAGGADAERLLTDAVISGLGHRDAPFIRTGGLWVHGAGDAITEATPRSAPEIVAWREAIDLPALRAPGIRSVLIEPGVVYGRGQGIPNVLTRADAVGDGEPALPLLGDGSQHWGTVHVDDLADLYVLALQRASHGSTFIAVNGSRPTVREIAVAASRLRGYQGRVRAESAATTVARLGAFGEALLLSQRASAERARQRLGWMPGRRDLLDEIESGLYTD